MKSFISKALESIKKTNEYAAIVENGFVGGDVDFYIPTGSYALNALISGDINKGIPSGKVIGLAGESSVGKSFFCIDVMRNFLAQDKSHEVVYFETEGALSKKMLIDRGVDISRVLGVPVNTLQEFKHQVFKILDEYTKIDKSERPRMLFILDSLGQLSSDAEINSAASNEDKQDMKRNQIIKSIFRIITLKLGIAQVPMLVTAHVYVQIGGMGNEIGGGSGLKYATTNIITMTKRKDRKSDGSTVGVIVTCTNRKNRLSKENTKAEVYISYQNGVNSIFYLPEMAIECGAFFKGGDKSYVPTKVIASGIKNHSEAEGYFGKPVTFNPIPKTKVEEIRLLSDHSSEEPALSKPAKKSKLTSKLASGEILGYYLPKYGAIVEMSKVDRTIMGKLKESMKDKQFSDLIQAFASELYSYGSFKETLDDEDEIMDESLTDTVSEEN